MKTKIFIVVTVFLMWILNLLLFKEKSDTVFTYFMLAGVFQSLLYKDKRLSYITGIVALSLILIVNKSLLWLWFLDFFTFTDHSPIWQIFISVSLIATILTVIYGRKLQTTTFNKVIGLLVCIVLPLIGCALVFIRHKFPDDEVQLPMSCHCLIVVVGHGYIQRILEQSIENPVIYEMNDIMKFSRSYDIVKLITNFLINGNLREMSNPIVKQLTASFFGATSVFAEALTWKLGKDFVSDVSLSNDKLFVETTGLIKN